MKPKNTFVTCFHLELLDGNIVPQDSLDFTDRCEHTVLYGVGQFNRAQYRRGTQVTL
jgi:hypothetical protein